MRVKTKKCQFCGKTGEVEVNEVQWQRYMSGMHIQDAFPGMPAGERELLITGTHSDCWDALFCTDDVDCEVHPTRGNGIIACPPKNRRP